LDAVSVLLREMQVNLAFQSLVWASRNKSETLCLLTNLETSSQFAPEEYLYRESEIAQEMFIILSGSVEELSETKEVPHIPLL
jgi:hypothetical protein